MQVILHAKSQIVQDIPGFVREQAEPGLINPFYADADLTAEQMGRLCYLSNHRPHEKTATNDRYLLNICYQRHYSVLAHSFASVYVYGVSRNCTHEIIRSRWFSFSEVSQRYVDVSNFEFVTHPGLTGDNRKAITPVTESLAESAWHSAKVAYGALVDDLTKAGVKHKEARQAARSFLPGGIETKIGMSGNLRAWRDFLAQRLAPGADLEIQGVALEVLKIMKAEFPNSFQDFDSKGMITTDRMIDRALYRHDAHAIHGREGDVYDFVGTVRDIRKNGLWTLKEDPWIDGEF